MFKNPEELKNTKTHEWVKEEDGLWTVGLTDFAQDALGDIVFVNLPSVGDEVKAGEVFCDVESVKAVSDVYSPVSGVIEEVNDALIMKEESVEVAVKNKASLVYSNKPPETRSLFFDKLNHEENPDFNRLYKQLCVYYVKTNKEKLIITAKRCVKRIINY